MNNLKQISLAQAIQCLRDKDDVYLIIPLKGQTKAKLLKKAAGFCILQEPELQILPETREEEILEEQTEEPMNETQAKDEKEPAKTGIDHGKIVALYTATPPRSVSWIADDIGCSPQTVINHLKREGIYKACKE